MDQVDLPYTEWTEQEGTWTKWTPNTTRWADWTSQTRWKRGEFKIGPDNGPTRGRYTAQ